MLRRKKGGWRIDGDPTEGALLVVGAKGGIRREEMDRRWKRVKEYPFDSERKRMSVLVEGPGGERMLLVKGAPDVLLERCTHILRNGKAVPLSREQREEVLRMNAQLAAMALRNLAFAYREIPAGKEPGPEERAERNLVFVGLAGMIDPPRDEVKEAIRRCRQAGIKPVMITGDHKGTAVAIARQLGILTEGGLAVEGQELDRMGESGAAGEGESHRRLCPGFPGAQAAHREGPAEGGARGGDDRGRGERRAGDQGGGHRHRHGDDGDRCVQGGLLPGSGRRQFCHDRGGGRRGAEHLRQYPQIYQLSPGEQRGRDPGDVSGHVGGSAPALVPIQILWVNLVTDGLPAMALGVDPAEEDTMRRPPRDSRESIFARGVGWKIVSRGLLIGLFVLGAFWVAYWETPGDLTRAQTMAFSTLVLAQLIYVFDCRSSRSIFHRNPLENRSLVLAVLSSVLLLLGVIYYTPLQPIFHTKAIGAREWLLVIAASSLPTLLAGWLDSWQPSRRAVPARWSAYGER